MDDIIQERPIEEKARILGVIDDAVSLVEELDENTARQYADVIKLEAISKIMLDICLKI